MFYAGSQISGPEGSTPPAREEIIRQIRSPAKTDGKNKNKKNARKTKKLEKRSLRRSMRKKSQELQIERENNLSRNDQIGIKHLKACLKRKERNQQMQKRKKQNLSKILRGNKLN